jgi:DNA-directed RNA polymerase specialized sigma24 family protein
MRIDEIAGPVDPTVNTAVDGSGRDRAPAMPDEANLGAIIWSAVAQLESRPREVFLLMRFQQHSLEYTAKVLEVSPADAGRLLAQATQEVNARILRAQQQPAGATAQPG